MPTPNTTTCSAFSEATLNPCVLRCLAGLCGGNIDWKMRWKLRGKMSGFVNEDVRCWPGSKCPSETRFVTPWTSARPSPAEPPEPGQHIGITSARRSTQHEVQKPQPVVSLRRSKLHQVTKSSLKFLGFWNFGKCASCVYWYNGEFDKTQCTSFDKTFQWWCERYNYPHYIVFLSWKRVCQMWWCQASVDPNQSWASEAQSRVGHHQNPHGRSQKS